MKKKLLIIGKNGFLGSALTKQALEDFEVFSLGSDEIDVASLESVQKVFAKIKPGIVINTAALAKTEECEQNTVGAIKLNILGSFNTAKASAQLGASLVYISTDYVFDGEKREYFESDSPKPINFYGISKLAGENCALAYNPKTYIIRSSVFFGASPSGKTGFVDLMIKMAKEKKTIKVVDDIFMSPTNIGDLSLVLLELLKLQSEYGIYHISNEGSCSWYEFAKEIFSLAGLEADLFGIKAKEQQVLTNRPKFSILTTEKLGKNKLQKMPDWQESLKNYITKKYI